MKRAARAGIVAGGVVAIGLAGAIALNAMQTGTHTAAQGSTPGLASAAPSTSGAAGSGAAKSPSTAPTSASGSPAASTGATPSTPDSGKTEASTTPATPAPAPAPAAPAPAPVAPAPAPAAQGLDAAGIKRIEDTCTARLQNDSASSAVVTGQVVPRPFTVVSIAFVGTPVRSTGTSGQAAYDILMKTTTKLVDGPTQDGQRICRVYDSGTHVDWLPAS
ncbi:hypothetical protein AB6813_21215 [bacterium RCC_150]